MNEKNFLSDSAIKEEKEALNKIKNILLVERMFSNFILKSKIKTILNNVKSDIKDITVSHAIDNLFSKYFKETPKRIDSEGMILPIDIEQLQDKNQDNMEYKDTGEQIGVSYVKRNGHYNSNSDSKSQAA